MSLFGWLDVAAGVLLVLAVLGIFALRVYGMFRHYYVGGKRRETWTRWPRWLPHSHDDKPMRSVLHTDTHQWEEWDQCMRCRRKKDMRLVPAGGRA